MSVYLFTDIPSEWEKLGYDLEHSYTQGGRFTD
jgi:hypothetical protein